MHTYAFTYCNLLLLVYHLNICRFIFHFPACSLTLYQMIYSQHMKTVIWMMLYHHPDFRFHCNKLSHTLSCLFHNSYLQWCVEVVFTKVEIHALLLTSSGARLFTLVQNTRVTYKGGRKQQMVSQTSSRTYLWRESLSSSVRYQPQWGAVPKLKERLCFPFSLKHF